MCGIIGAIGEYDKMTFRKAVSLISHRGPDDEGYYFDDQIALGHRRLTVLDTSDRAHQPMISSDGRFILIYNGEVYNYKEIKTGLEHKYSFHSTGDTETLLYAYIEYGNEVFNMLNGIFALAIYDSVKKQVTIARDHFGVKPLYYYIDAEKFLFASELKSINLFQIDKSLDYKAIFDYLRFLYGPFQNTPFKYVKKLEPGNYYTLKVNDFHNLKKKKYYEIPYTGCYTMEQDCSALNRLEEIFSSSVKRQMLSDVPIGFFLSGGLDSSAVVAMARKCLPDENLECFTADTSQYGDFDGFTNDLPYARKVADTFNCNLNVVEANNDIVNSFETMIWNLEEPLTDPAALHVASISEKAQGMGIKVLLGGTGGDEIFSGYRRHQAFYFERYFKWIPGMIMKILARNAGRLNNNIPVQRRIGKILYNLDTDISHRLFNYHTWFPKAMAINLLHDDIKEVIRDYNPYLQYMNILENIPDESSWLNKMLFWEKKTYLAGNNLNYLDKMTMASGIEARVPFLDIEIVNFASTLEPNLKMKGLTTKYILRKMMESYLPNDIIYRPKTGFGVPVRKWIKNDMNEMISDMLEGQSIRNCGCFNPSEVSKLIKLNRLGKIDASYIIWSMLSIVTWLKLYTN